MPPAQLISFPVLLSFPARRLISLSRDLFQATDLGSIIDQIGPALRELLSPDSALVIANIEGSEFAAAFDCRGSVAPIQSAQPLYARVQQAQATPERGRVVLQDVVLEAKESNAEPVHGSFLYISFPFVNPWGAVAALWNSVLDTSRLRSYEEILGCISELTGAAMGNVVAKMILEEQMAATEEVSKETTDQLVQEIRRREEELKEKHYVATTDVLTGMLNRRGFFERAEQDLKLARRQGIACAVIFADLDGLKDVNDRWGHGAGDACLRAAAEVLKQSFRDSDVVGRLGGDEFAAFTVDAAPPDVIIERIAKNTELLYQRAGLLQPLSFSIGITQCDPSGTHTLAEYLSQADKKMYEQKKIRRRKPESDEG